MLQTMPLYIAANNSREVYQKKLLKSKKTQNATAFKGLHVHNVFFDCSG